MSIRDKRQSPHFSRRGFLASLGVAAAASPFVPLLNASGQEGARPRRLLLVYTPHGTIWERWKPTGTETDFQLGPILAPLEKWKKKLVVVAGVMMPTRGPGAPHTKHFPLIFTGSQLLEDTTFTRGDASGGMHFGWNSGPSVDQFIIQRTQPSTAYRSIEFGVRTGSYSHPMTRMIYTAAKAPLAADGNPYAIFDRLFTSKGGDQLRAERQSAIDVVRSDLAGLKIKVATEDRQKLDAHLETIRNIERRLSVTASLCKGTSPLAGLQGARVDPNSNSNTPWTLDRQLELISVAFACDVTRFASLQYTIGDTDNNPYPWLGITGRHHELTHANANDTLTKIYTWYSERIAYLLEKLDAIPEGNGSVLDNTMIVWGSEVGNGGSHTNKNVPFIIAGGGGGAIRPGRFLQVPSATAHHRILVSACNVMGVPDATTFGNLDTGSGPLRGLLA